MPHKKSTGKYPLGKGKQSLSTSKVIGRRYTLDKLWWDYTEAGTKRNLLRLVDRLQSEEGRRQWYEAAYEIWKLGVAGKRMSYDEPYPIYPGTSFEQWFNRGYMTIYRGVRVKDGLPREDRWVWTLSGSVAESFAVTFMPAVGGGPPPEATILEGSKYVLVGKIRTNEVLGYSDRIMEHEVIAQPRVTRILKFEEVNGGVYKGVAV